MRINQVATVSADPELSAAVAGKNQLLEATIDGSAAEATWELNGDEGRPNLVLRVRDRTGNRSRATFPPFVLKNEADLVSRLTELKVTLQRVAEWRKVVEAFFDRVRPWCEALPGFTKLQQYTRVAKEAASGEYDIPELGVVCGDRAMVLAPVGAWVLGADGRIDMIGPSDRAVLEYRRAGDFWYHVPNDIPYREIPLTESLFRELAEACLDD